MNQSEYQELSRIAKAMTLAFVRRYGAKAVVNHVIDDLISETIVNAVEMLEGSSLLALSDEDQGILVGKAASKALGEYRRQEGVARKIDPNRGTPRYSSIEPFVGDSDATDSKNDWFAVKHDALAPSAEDIALDDLAHDDLDADAIESIVGIELSKRERQVLMDLANNGGTYADLAARNGGTANSVQKVVERARRRARIVAEATNVVATGHGVS